MIFTKLLTPEVVQNYPCFEILDKKGIEDSSPYSDIHVKMRVKNCASILMEVQNGT